jgi:hypothetical protein
LPVAAATQSEHAAGTCNQEEEWYSPGVDCHQNAHDSLAFYRIVDVPRHQRIKGFQYMIQEDSKYENIAQPIEIVQAGRFFACLVHFLSPSVSQ